MVCMEREKRFKIVDERVESFINQSVEQYKGVLGEIRKEDWENKKLPIGLMKFMA